MFYLLKESRNALFLLWKGGSMEKVKRPKRVSKEGSSYLSNEEYQEYAEKQFKNIYEKLDEIVNKLNN